MNKVQPQLQHMINGFKVSNHRLLNMIANGLTKLIDKKVPGLKLKYGGKSINDNTVSAVLTGEIIFSNKDEFDNASDKIRSTMQQLQNQSNLITILKE